MNQAQLTEFEQKSVERFCTAVLEGKLGNAALVQIIELAGGFLNLQTLSNYAKEHGKSYNGVKKCRNTQEILGVKWVIDNA